jgi:diaminopimelate epimerase
MIPFVKMHGTGNDFVVIPDLDDRYVVSPDAAKALCDRHFGMGADGVIRIAPGAKAPFFMDYRNSDGSLAGMCGNGTRVVGKWLGDNGHADDTVELETRGGVKVLQLNRNSGDKTESVRVDMGPPEFDESKTLETLDVDGQLVEFVNIDIGCTPHAVVVVDNLATIDITKLGPSMARCGVERFPDGINVSLAHVVNTHEVNALTYERGAGLTLACGTGASAVAVATRRLELVDTHINIHIPGGELQLSWNQGESVFMTGPAAHVYSGEFDPTIFGVAHR